MTSRYGFYLLRAVGIVQDNQPFNVIKELLNQQIVGCKMQIRDNAYVSLFSWDVRIPGCVGAITHVDCDGWESPY